MTYHQAVIFLAEFLRSYIWFAIGFYGLLAVLWTAFRAGHAYQERKARRSEQRLAEARYEAYIRQVAEQFVQRAGERS